jgi:hypothetical protein
MSLSISRMSVDGSKNPFNPREMSDNAWQLSSSLHCMSNDMGAIAVNIRQTSNEICHMSGGMWRWLDDI